MEPKELGYAAGLGLLLAIAAAAGGLTPWGAAFLGLMLLPAGVFGLRRNRAQVLRMGQLRAQCDEYAERCRSLQGQSQAGQADANPLLLAEKVLSCSNEASLITDASTRILHVNDAFCAAVAMDRQRLMGLRLHSLRSVVPDPSFWGRVRRGLRQEGKWSGEVNERSADGTSRLKWLNISAVCGQDGQPVHYVAFISDITRARQSEDALYRLVHFDHLTDIPNRRMFRDQFQLCLNHAQRYGRDLALLYIDLDRFGNVNESLGHRAGDQLLTQVAGRLGSVLRNTDLLARFGGDEFAVLLVEKGSQADAALVARRLMDQFVLPFCLDGNELYVSASMGIALYGGSGNDQEQLLREADGALSHAKEQGRNNFKFYCPEINRHLTGRLALERDLKAAVEADELFLHYQPKMDLETAAVTGIEALVRWRHPIRGMISPSEFIPLAEEVGLIDVIGQRVLRKGCAQLRRWMEQGLPEVPLAVNLSERQFLRHDLASEIRAVLEETGLDPFLLEVEITENTLLKDMDHTARVLGMLKELGLSIVIDDFGTGFSSLRHLRHLPIDRLKIDRSFLEEEALGADNAAIISAVIALAHSLGFKVVAEGVETEGTLGFLRMRGCDEAQGYVLSRPLDAENFGTYLRDYSVSKKVTPLGWSQISDPVGHA